MSYKFSKIGILVEEEQHKCVLTDVLHIMCSVRINVLVVSSDPLDSATRTIYRVIA
jgi:hypothetical protein